MFAEVADSEMARLPVPIIIVIIGEGASGGALGIGVGDRILMLENTWYSVISPEGCASILYRDAGKANIAAESMKVTAKDMFELGVADELVKEPDGSAHRNPDAMAKKLKEVILRNLNELCAIEIDELVRRRIEKYSRMGSWTEDK